MACQGLTFLPPNVSACLLGAPRNIAEAYQLLYPLMASQAPTYEEVLDSLQFTYTEDSSGEYVALV